MLAVLAGCGSFGSRGGDFVPVKGEKEKSFGPRRRWRKTAPVGGKMKELKKPGADDEWADLGPMRSSEPAEREEKGGKPGKKDALPPLSAGPAGAKGAPLAAGAPGGGGTISLEGATLASGGVDALPSLSSLDNAAIKGMMEKRLDIGGYRVQLSETEDFGAPIFDGSYDIMQPIDLMDELAKAGIKTEREAYWVRIAFIDLLAVEEPFTKPRLYGLDKRRRAAVEEE